MEHMAEEQVHDWAGARLYHLTPSEAVLVAAFPQSSRRWDPTLRWRRSGHSVWTAERLGTLQRRGRLDSRLPRAGTDEPLRRTTRSVGRSALSVHLGQTSYSYAEDRSDA